MRELVAALPRAMVIEDTGDAVGKRLNRRGCWPIARRGWLAMDQAASHHLVLEDDAGLCTDFATHLQHAVDANPAACISLFRGTRDCSVATVMPSSVVRVWLSWCDTAKHGARHLPHHDYLITQGCKELGVEHLHTEPSLVEHLPFASLLDHSHVSATRFEQSPTEVTFRRRA